MTAGCFDVAVVGGGIAGLVAAFRVTRTHPLARVVVLEERARVGGNVRTLTRDGCFVDLGPDAFATLPVDLVNLCDDLGIGDQLTPPSEAARRISIAEGGRLHQLPDGLAMGLPSSPFSLATTSLLSRRGKLRAAMDLVLPPNRTHAWSVGELVGRRLGREVQDRLVSPLFAGIYGGDVDTLDARVALPMLAQTRGSLIRKLASTAPARGRRLVAPRGGMQQLVESLENRLGASRIRTSTPCVSVHPIEGGWRVRLRREQDDAIENIDTRHLVVAAPSYAASSLVATAQPELASLLRRIRSRTCASVVLAFDASSLPEPDSSGFLVARGERLSFAAITYTGRKWPTRVRRGRVILRAVVDEANDPELCHQDDPTLVGRVLADLRTFHAAGEPVWTHVERYVRASPIPDIGHPERVQRANDLARAARGLWLAGGSYEGPGLVGAAASGARAAAGITQALSTSPGRW